MKVAATTDLSDSKVMSWDTEFWGVRTGKAVRFDGLSEWAVANTVGLVFLLIDANDTHQAQQAEQHGFRFMDVRVTLEQPHPYIRPVQPASRQARPADTDTLCAIARTAFPLTRFYADPSLDDERCDDLYDTWTRSSCEGGADMVLVSERDRVPVGFVTVDFGDDTAEIGLIAVAADYRGQGVGGELVDSALDHCWHQRLPLRVVTQGRNIGALQTFESRGFRTVNTSLWFHKRYQ